MTENEKMEGGKLIAIFMGWIFNEEGECANTEWTDKFESRLNYFSPNIVQNYHSDWSWLMPVWVKFRDMQMREEIKALHINFIARLSQDLAYSTIEEFFHNLCVAIKWYNNQK